jgi:pimeloyl-ACP methyl ester carboxylesterase
MVGSSLLRIALLACAATTLAAQTVPPGPAAPAEAVDARWRGFEPAFREQPCPFGGAKLGGRRLSCGYVLVPEDRTDPDSRLISVSVAKAAAPGDANPAHAVVFLQGGPGGAALEDLAEGAGSFARGAPLPDGDLIAFDQRGTGYSDARLCRGVERTPDPAGSDAAEGRYRDALARCIREARARGIAVDAYSTWHNAHDVRDLRRALGYTQWNLWGLSYGTRLARAVMDVDPDGIRAAVLDSASPATFPTGFAQGLRSSLDAVDSACAAHARCAEDVGSLTERFVAVIAAYDVEPLVLEVEADAASDARLVVDGELLASTLRALLYRAEVYKDLPILLHMLEERDRGALAAYARVVLSTAEPSLDFGAGMELVTNCRWHVPDAATSERWRAAEPLLSRWTVAPAWGDNLRARCEHAYRIAPDAAAVALESSIPTLVLAGLADPITPPAFARAVLSSLPNGKLLEFPHVGHAVLATLERRAPGCGTGLLAQFFSNPASNVDASCASAIVPPDFLTRVRQTQGPIELMLRARNGAWPVGPALALAVLLFAVFGFPLGAAGRRLDGRRDTALGSVRIVAWIGAAASIAGAAVAALVLRVMIADHPVALARGLLPSIGWAGGLGLAGAIAAWAAAVHYLRCWPRAPRRIGTAVGIFATALASGALFVFLVSIGAGPF